MNECGTLVWRFLRLVVLNLCVVSTFGCASSTMALSKKPTAQMLEESARQADVLIALEREFASAHQLKGVVVRAAIKQLAAEGFYCSLEYKKLPVLKKGTIDQFGFETIPMIYCSKLHSRTSVDDICNVMWAAFEVDWRDPAEPLETLRREFDVSTIRTERYFCLVSRERQSSAQ